MRNLINYFTSNSYLNGFFLKLLDVICSTFSSLVHLSMLGKFLARFLK